MNQLIFNGQRILSQGKSLSIGGSIPPPINPVVTFTKTDYGTEVDQITDSVWITRGEQEGLFNPKVESSFDYTNSVMGAEWNADGWDSLLNLRTRDYITSFYDFCWVPAIDGAINLPGKELILHCIAEDKYYKVKVIDWHNGSNNPGGGFTYERQEVLSSQMDPLPTNGMILKAFDQYSDFNVAFSVVTEGSADYTVDWGDGNTETFTSNSTAEHAFLANTNGSVNINSTSTLRGFRLRPNSISQQQKIVSVRFFESDFTDLSYAFYDGYSNVSSLEKVTFPNSPMNSLTNLDYAFSGCSGLSSFPLPSNLPALQSMNCAFNGTKLAGSLSLTLPLVTDMNETFRETKLSHLDLDAPNLENMTSTCRGIYDLLSASLNSNKLITIESAFSECPQITDVIFTATSIPTLVNASKAFQNSTQFSGLTMPDVPNLEDISYTFQTTKIVSFPLSPSLPKVKNMAGCLTYCYDIISVELSNLDSVENMDNAFSYTNHLESVTLPSALPMVSNITDLFRQSSITGLTMPDLGPSIGDAAFAQIFDIYYSNSLKYLEINYLSGVTSLENVWKGAGRLLQYLYFRKPLPGIQNIMNMVMSCGNLIEVDIHNLPNIVNAYSTFAGCTSLENIILPSSLEYLTSAAHMIDGCSLISSITIPDAPVLDSLEYTFINCSGLIDVSFGNLPLLTNAVGVFYSCQSLETINLPSALPSLVYAANMFEYTKLTGFTLPELPVVTNILHIFEGCSLLQTVNFNPVINYISNSNMNSLFNGCTALTAVNLIDSQFSNENLNTLFYTLPSTSGTINVTGAVGAATCDKSIATGKGWTVIPA